MQLQRYVLIDALHAADLDENAIRPNISGRGGTSNAIRIEDDGDAFQFFLALAEILENEGEDGISVARKVAQRARVETLGKSLYLYLPGVEIGDGPQ